MRIVSLLLILALATGCTKSTGSLQSHPLVASDIAIAPGLWSGLAWSGHFGLVVASDGRAPGNGPIVSRPTLVSIDPQLGTAQAIDLPDSDCGALRSLRLAALPRGEVGLADICLNDSRVDQRYETTFLVLEPDGGVRSLGTLIGDLAPVTFAWNQALTSVVYEVDGSLCATLYTYTAEAGSRPLGVTAEVDGELVELGEDLGSNADGCTRTGRAARPAYAPDGQRLALLASPAGGRTGQDRIDLPWGLVVLSPDGVATTILEGLRDPLGVAWISEGDLLVTATLNGQRGVWRVPVGGGDPVLVASEAVGALAVAPDGRAFAGFPECAPPDCTALETSRVLIFQLVPTQGE